MTFCCDKISWLYLYLLFLTIYFKIITQAHRKSELVNLRSCVLVLTKVQRGPKLILYLLDRSNSLFPLIRSTEGVCKTDIVRHGKVNSIQNRFTVTNRTMDSYCSMSFTLPCVAYNLCMVSQTPDCLSRDFKSLNTRCSLRSESPSSRRIFT